MLDMINSDKPILTSYAGMYDPKTDRLLNNDPYKMVASNFTNSGTILFRPHSIENWQSLTKPIPARFVSGHFFFTIGQHCLDYKYDPNLYFAGDEISLSIRSYTLGYDLYHPHKTVIWHEYTREGRTKHWTDFNIQNKNFVDKMWWEMDNDSKRRLRYMLQEEDDDIDLGEYGLGNIRSHKSYELYAGIDFKRKLLHPLTIKGIEPPINDYTDWWKMAKKQYSFDLVIPKPKEDFRFIYIGIEDNHGKLLYRQDLKNYQETLKVNFESYEKPHKWVYWINNKNEEWTARLDTIIKGKTL